MNLFELPLSSPYCWHPSKVRRFVNESHKFLENKKNDPQVVKFLDDMKANAITLHAWYPNNNWEDGLGTQDFPILSKFKKTQRNVDNTSIVTLHGIMRNKDSHYGEFPENEKIQLAWHVDGNIDKIDDQKWTTYWMRKFPKLIPFLWWELRQYSQELQEFYPSIRLANLKLQDFVDQINQACKEQMHAGLLETRYRFGNNLTVEFRPLQTNFLQQVLYGKSTLQVKISSSVVVLRWEDVTGSATHTHSEGLLQATEANLVFSNRDLSIGVEDEEDNFILEHFSESTTNEKVIIFTTNRLPCQPTSIHKIVKKIAIKTGLAYQEYPLQLHELDSLVQEHVKKSGEVDCQLGKIKVAHLFSENEICGGLLASLLRKEIPTIFAKHQLPENEGIYIERLLYDFGKVTSEAFHENLKDAIILTNIKYDAMAKLFPNMLQKWHELSSLEAIIKMLPKKQFFFLNHDISNEEFENSLNHCLQSSKYKTIHCFRFETHTSFHWVASKGQIFDMGYQYNQASRNVNLMNERNFIKYLPNSERLIFIADLPGMGKTYVLKSLATKLANGFKNRLIMVLDIKDFISQFSNIDVVTESKKAIVQCCCSTKFEESIVCSWLDDKSGAAIKLEILLDGLDEVYYEERENAITLLKVIWGNFPSIRLWATVREHMQNEIRIEFGTLGYKIEPFAQKQQISYLTEHWKNYCSQNKLPIPSLDKLNQFAKDCNSIPRNDDECEIAGIPLYCYMIATIYENKVLEPNCTLDHDVDFSLDSLYKQLLDRKFSFYSKRERIPESIVHFVKNGIDATLVRYAVELLFGTQVLEKYTEILFVGKDEKSEEAIKGHGVVKQAQPVQFIHRTFAEYVLADFVYLVTRNQNSQFIKLNNDSYQEFVSEHLLAVTWPRSSSSISESVPSLKHPVLCNFLHTKLATVLNKSEIMPHIKSMEQNPRLQYLRSSFAIICVETKFPQLKTVNSLNYLHKSLLALLVSRPHREATFILSLGQTSHWVIAKYIIECYNEIPVKRMNQLLSGLPGIRDLQPLLHIIFNRHNINSLSSKDFYNLKFLVEYIVEKDSGAIECKDACLNRTPFLNLIVGLQLTKGELTDDHFTFLNYFISVADISATDRDGNNVLHLIVSREREIDDICFMETYPNFISNCSRLLKYFLPRCSKLTINQLNEKGDTALSCFVKELGSTLGSNKLVHVFQKHKVDFNKKGKGGNTALHVAVLEDFLPSESIITALIQCGASKTIKNSSGLTPIDIAKRKGNQTIVKILHSVNCEN